MLEELFIPTQCPDQEQDTLGDESDAHFPLLQTRSSEQSLLEEQEAPRKWVSRTELY